MELLQSERADPITMVNLLVEFYQFKETHSATLFAQRYSLNIKNLLEAKSLVH